MSTGAANPNISNSNSAKVVNIYTGDYAAADEGSYFTSWLGATANTAVATTTQALGTTSPSLVIFNGNAPGGYNIYLRYARFRMTAVTTGATTVEHVGVLSSNTSKITTVGTLMSTPNNSNSANSVGSGASLWGGVNVAATPASQDRIVHTGHVAGSIPIVLDAWTFTYGEPVNTATTFIETAATVKTIVVSLPPIVIAPRWYYTLGFWGASWAASAQTYRMEVGWIERPTGQ